MKNADSMLRIILDEVDTSGDGKIQYEGKLELEYLLPCPIVNEQRAPKPNYGITLLSMHLLMQTGNPTEFRTFVERADRQLLALFESIDRDGNGRLDSKELQVAFRNAGLTVSNRRLLDFFNDMDHNNDGFITFEEWR